MVDETQWSTHDQTWSACIPLNIKHVCFPNRLNDHFFFEVKTIDCFWKGCMRYLLQPMIMRAWSTASHQFNFTLNLNEDVVENVIIEIISSASHRIDYHLKRKKKPTFVILQWNRRFSSTFIEIHNNINMYL